MTNNQVQCNKQNAWGHVFPKETYVPTLYMVYAKIMNVQQQQQASERAGTAPRARQPCSHDQIL